MAPEDPESPVAPRYTRIEATVTIAVAVAIWLVFCMGAILWLDARADDIEDRLDKIQPAHVVCWEDEPCWDCETMGNRDCGTEGNR